MAALASSNISRPCSQLGGRSFKLILYGGDLSSADGSFELPLTQDLAAALGLTSVHVNRVLQKLRSEALLEFACGVLRIHDMPRLKCIAKFDPTYLAQ